MDRASAHRNRPSAGQTARFTAIVAILAIFSDAAVGHGLAWENDPYWTYWITKTFLIATIFGLGTAWFGIGPARGLAITGVHTVVLTVYYWTFSPVGLPSSPEWLDLEHTWVTGIPIHFGVIYLGYLLALWLWRRQEARTAEDDGVARGTAALVTAVAITVVSGGLASLALADFPGVTWFLVRLLLTVPFLLWWWAWAGRDRVGAVAGGIVLAFVWATYAQFLGPTGLPDAPLRILDPSPPPATLQWLDYRQLWLISFPIYLITMVVALLIEARRSASRSVRAGAAVAVIAGLLLVTGAASGETLDQEGTSATISASGPAQIEQGNFYGGTFEPGTGELHVEAEDMGARVTPLPPHDRLVITASLNVGGEQVAVSVREPMVSHPLGEHTTWWGVGLDVEHHGESGIGTSKLPSIHSELAAFGLGEVSIAGERVATGLPVHVMTAESGLPDGARIELDVGMDGETIPGLPAGHLRVLWADYDARIENPHPMRYAIGAAVLVLLLAGLLALLRRDHAD